MVVVHGGDGKDVYEGWNEHAVEEGISSIRECRVEHNDRDAMEERMDVNADANDLEEGRNGVSVKLGVHVCHKSAGSIWGCILCTVALRVRVHVTHLCMGGNRCMHNYELYMCGKYSPIVLTEKSL